MPAIVKIEANPDFKPETADDEKAFSAAKAAGQITVPHITAMENIAKSKGLYRMVNERKAEPIESGPQLEAMTSDQLKEVATKMGITIRKQRVARSDLIEVIRERLAQIAVDEDE